MVGLDRLFAKHLGFGKAKHAAYPLHQVFFLLVLACAVGFERVFHLSGLEDDPLFRRKSGLKKLPDYTTCYNDLGRFDELEKVEPLRKVLVGMARRSERKTCILDFDSTVETVYGNQELAEKGYNPEKPGRKSYHPLLVFEGVSQALVNAMFRPGKRSSSASFMDVIPGVNPPKQVFSKPSNQSRSLNPGFHSGGESARQHNSCRL